MFPTDVPGLEALARQTRLRPAAVEALAGDVGRRRYFRMVLTDNRTVLGVVYPPEEEDSRRRWMAARAVLHGRVRVPAVLADDSRGNQIVEDFGPEDLSSRLASTVRERAVWLGRAAEAAASIADAPDPGINSPFNAALFRRELDLAREAVFEMFLGAPLTPADRQTHDEWAETLVDEIIGHPFALCHRDFHANNLFAPGQEIAVIDFQDLRLGPDSYDLASLLWERSTLGWMSEDTALAATERFARRRGIDGPALHERSRRVLLQRAWKVCGTFARAVAQGRGQTYRLYLPPELALVRRLLTSSETDRRFAAVLKARCAAVC